MLATRHHLARSRRLTHGPRRRQETTMATRPADLKVGLYPIGRALVLLTIALGAGCSTAQAIRENSRAIAGSTASISMNTDAIRESTSGTTRLVPALDAVSKLEEPMRSLARL